MKLSSYWLQKIHPSKTPKRRSEEVSRFSERPPNDSPRHPVLTDQVRSVQIVRHLSMHCWVGWNRAALSTPWPIDRIRKSDPMGRGKTRWTQLVELTLEKWKPPGPDGIYHYKPPWNAAEQSELRPATSQSKRSFRTMPDKIFHHLSEVSQIARSKDLCIKWWNPKGALQATHWGGPVVWAFDRNSSARNHQQLRERHKSSDGSRNLTDRTPILSCLLNTQTLRPFLRKKRPTSWD